MRKQYSQMARRSTAQKEALIRDAITSRLGDEWTIADITDRGEFTVTLDGTEIFTFDGVDLIHFSPTRAEVDESLTTVTPST